MTWLTALALAAAGPVCKGPADLEAAIARKPSAAAYNALGAHFAREQKFDCAIRNFETAFKLDPKLLDTQFNMGLAYLEKGDPKRAAALLGPIAERQTNVAPLQMALGTALFEAARFAEAEAPLRAALRLDPKSEHAKDYLARTLIELRRYNAAIDLLEQLPQTPDTLTAIAMAKSRSGHNAEAIEILRRVVAGQPRDPRAHFNLASAFAQEKRFRESADSFRQALRLDPSNDVARVSLVKSLTALGENDEALPLIEDYVARNPRDFEGPYLLGVVYRGMARDGEAESQLRRAASMQSDHFDIQYNLGVVLLRVNKVGDAEKHLRRALALNPESSEARFQLGNALRKQGKAEGAEEELTVFKQQREQTMQENSAAVVASQGNAYLQKGNAKKAVEAYREAVRLDPRNARTHYNLALALARLQDARGEREALERAVTLNARIAPAQNQLGLLDLNAGKLESAEKRFRAALEAEPQLAEAQSNLGVLLGRQGRHTDAERLFRQAIEDNPRYTQAFVNLALVLAAQNRFGDAEKELNRGLGIEPDHLQALTALGMVQTRLGRAADGAATFARVTKLNPSAEAFLNLGIAHADQSNYEQALAAFTESVKLAPQLPAAHYNRGRALFDLRRYEEAVPELTQANTPEALYPLALAEKQLGNIGKSADILRKLIAAVPNNSDAHYYLGQNLSRLGKPDEAIVHWKRAYELNNDNSQALYALVRAFAVRAPEESKRYQTSLQQLQMRRHMTDQAEMLNNLALASAGSHDWQQAFTQLEEAIKLCDGCRSKADLHKNLGLIYCRSGDVTRGAEQLRIAEKLKPGDPDVIKALEVIKSLP